jgi:hypothetical protein
MSQIDVGFAIGCLIICVGSAAITAVLIYLGRHQS